MIEDRIHIGQGYKVLEFDGVGIGTCTKGCTNGSPGCPPKAKYIIRFIERASSSQMAD